MQLVSKATALSKGGDNVFVHNALNCKGTPCQQRFYFMLFSWLHCRRCIFFICLFMFNLYKCELKTSFFVVVFWGIVFVPFPHRGMMMRQWWIGEERGPSRKPTLSKKILKVTKKQKAASCCS